MKGVNPGWSPVHERATALAFDQQTVSAHVVTWQKSHTERKRPGKSRGTSLLLRFLYWIYERRLLDQLKKGPTPRHIGIILDGNRRHARKRGRGSPCEMDKSGAEKLDDILDWCSELRIPAVTLWVFSTERVSDLRRKFPAFFLRSKPRLRRLLMILSCTRNASASRPSVASTSSRTRSLPQFARPDLPSRAIRRHDIDNYRSDAEGVRRFPMLSVASSKRKLGKGPHCQMQSSASHRRL